MKIDVWPPGKLATSGPMWERCLVLEWLDGWPYRLLLEDESDLLLVDEDGDPVRPAYRESSPGPAETAA